MGAARRKRIKIGLIQMSVPPRKDQALQKAAKMVQQAARRGAKIICLPELFATPYFPQIPSIDVNKFSESATGKTARLISKLSRELHAVIIAPIYEQTKRKKNFNTALVFNERGRLLGKYHKIHIPNDPGFYEKKYFDEGKTGYQIFNTKFSRFAVLICYDQWFPEAARAARLAGAQIIFYPTALGDIVGYKPEGDWHEAWETIQRGHAIGNSVYVAAVNRIGVEGRMRFFGQSFVSDPFGKVLKRASKSKDEILVQKIDLERNKFFADGWGFLRNRRPETYKILTSKKLVSRSRAVKDVAHYKAEIKALKSK